MNYVDILKTKDSKHNFLKGLIRLAKADGVVSPEERQYFVYAASVMGLDAIDVAQIEDCFSGNETISINFTSDIEKLFFLREGIQLCAVDDSYDNNERTEVHAIAAELGIPEKVTARIEAWVEEGMEWKRRGELLLSLD